MKALIAVISILFSVNSMAAVQQCDPSWQYFVHAYRNVHTNEVSLNNSGLFFRTGVQPDGKWSEVGELNLKSRIAEKLLFLEVGERENGYVIEPVLVSVGTVEGLELDSPEQIGGCYEVKILADTELKIEARKRRGLHCEEDIFLPISHCRRVIRHNHKVTIKKGKKKYKFQTAGSMEFP